MHNNNNLLGWIFNISRESCPPMEPPAPVTRTVLNFIFLESKSEFGISLHKATDQ